MFTTFNFKYKTLGEFLEEAMLARINLRVMWTNRKELELSVRLPNDVDSETYRRPVFNLLQDYSTIPIMIPSNIEVKI